MFILNSGLKSYLSGFFAGDAGIGDMSSMRFGICLL